MCCDRQGHTVKLEGSELYEPMGEKRYCWNCGHVTKNGCEYYGNCSGPGDEMTSAWKPVAQTDNTAESSNALSADPEEMEAQADAMANQRGSVLLEAHSIINGERQDSYGNPEDSLQLIADYWSIYISNCSAYGFTGANIEIDIEPIDVANMMILLKQARKLGQKQSIDNYRDAAGYEGIGGDMVGKQQE